MGSSGLTAPAEPSTPTKTTKNKRRNMVVTKEVTRGTFDPRTYKDEDPVNWARKRKPEWMATTGKIHYVRERTVESQEKELEEQRKKEEAEKKVERPAEILPGPGREIVRQPPTEMPIKTNVEKKEVNTYWPRKMRSDITRSRVV